MSGTRAQRMHVTGRYGGPLSRLLAFGIDAFFVTTSFTFGVALLSYGAGLISGSTPDPTRSSGLWWTLGLIAWTYTYALVSLFVAARTPGKTIVGLRIVGRQGTPLKPRAAVIRTLCMPLTFLTLGLGFVGLFVGRERRALHDVLGKTAVIYDWGDRAAELPGPLTRYLARNTHVPDDFASEPG